MALALLFAGQGAQKVGMGRSLYEASPAARALYDEANRVLGWDLAKISFEGPEPTLTETKVCQPALYVHGLALLAALREKGRLTGEDPRLVLGLSLGEVTACTAACGRVSLRAMTRLCQRRRNTSRSGVETSSAKA